MAFGKTIEQAGVALFGDNYKSALANALGVSADRVDDWSKDRGNVPSEGVWLEIQALLQDRHEMIPAALALVVARASVTTFSLTYSQISNEIGRTAPWADDDFLADLQRMLSRHAQINNLGAASISAEAGRYVVEVSPKIDARRASLLRPWLIPAVQQALRKHLKSGG